MRVWIHSFGLCLGLFLWKDSTTPWLCCTSHAHCSSGFANERFVLVCTYILLGVFFYELVNGSVEAITSSALLVRRGIMKGHPFSFILFYRRFAPCQALSQVRKETPPLTICKFNFNSLMEFTKFNIQFSVACRMQRKKGNPRGSNPCPSTRPFKVCLTLVYQCYEIIVSFIWNGFYSFEKLWEYRVRLLMNPQVNLASFLRSILCL